mgnify:CR=1 FL=1
MKLGLLTARFDAKDWPLDRIIDFASEAGSNVIDVYVSSLRKKIDPGVIETVIGAGYRFRGCS